MRPAAVSLVHGSVALSNFLCCVCAYTSLRPLRIRGMCCFYLLLPRLRFRVAFLVTTHAQSGCLLFAGTTRPPLGPFSELSAICCTSLQTCIAPLSLPLLVCVPGCSQATSGSTSLRTLSSSSTLPYRRACFTALRGCNSGGAAVRDVGCRSALLFAAGLRPCSYRKMQMAFGRSASRIASRFRPHGLSAIRWSQLRSFCGTLCSAKTGNSAASLTRLA